jgi:hypothetical protein
VRGRHFTIPPPGETRFVSNEVLFEFSNGASAQARGALVRSLQLTQLEAQSFALTGRTIERWRIDGMRTVRDTLRLVARNFPSVVSGQANGIYLGAQAQPTTKQDAAADWGAAQYVVRKLHFFGGSPHQQRRRCVGRCD